MRNIDLSEHLLDLGEDKFRVMKCPLDKSVGFHKHDFVEIAFLARGSCVHSYQETEIVLIPGDVFTIRPFQEHSYKITEKTVIYNSLFYPDFLGSDWNRLNQLSGVFDFLYVEPFYRKEAKEHAILHLDINQMEFLESLFQLMLDEQSVNDCYHDIIQKSNLLSMLCFLGRIWDRSYRLDDKRPTVKRDILACAIKYIEENISNELKINDIAAKAYISPNSFRKKFREMIGVGPVEYINKLRISKARSLLKDSSKSISDVAYSVGICDPNYFSRLFRSQEKISPSQYRKKLNNAKSV